MRMCRDSKGCSSKALCKDLIQLNIIEFNKKNYNTQYLFLSITNKLCTVKIENLVFNSHITKNKKYVLCNEKRYIVDLFDLLKIIGC